jgi:hypothetical protein
MSQAPEPRPRIPNVYRPVMLDGPFEEFVEQGEGLVIPWLELRADILTAREIRALITLGDAAIQKANDTIVENQPDTFDDELWIPTYKVDVIGDKYVSLGIRHELLYRERGTIVNAIRKKLGSEAPEFGDYNGAVIIGTKRKGVGYDLSEVIKQSLEPYRPEGVALDKGVID